MAPIMHITVSAPLGILVGILTQSMLAGLLCFFSGFLIDVDHLLEYFIYYGLKDPYPKRVYHACSKMAKSEEEGGVKKLFLILHTAEIAILLWIGYFFTGNIYFLATALGYSGHLMLDASSNALKPYAYFITARIKNGFRTTKFTR